MQKSVHCFKMSFTPAKEVGGLDGGESEVLGIFFLKKEQVNYRWDEEVLEKLGMERHVRFGLGLGDKVRNGLTIGSSR
jgi:hypothetical protein